MTLRPGIIMTAAALLLGLAAPAFAQDPGPTPPAPAAQKPPTPADQPPPAPAPADQPPAAQQQPPAQSPAPDAQAVPPEAPAGAPTPRPNPAGKVEVPTGTRLPLVLHNAISTRSTRPGDPAYFETLFPVILDGRVVIPAGSYVSGEVTESKRAGHVKGRAELMVKLNTLILPNGYMVDLNATPSNAGTGGGETTNSEGKVIGDTNKGEKAATVAKTTVYGAGIGTGIGAAAGHVGAGAGIGAAAGAAVGLTAVLLSRGPDAEMPRGTTVDVTLNRPVFLDADKAQFTGPGQASTLAGPPNREPVRNKIPF